MPTKAHLQRLAETSIVLTLLSSAPACERQNTPAPSPSREIFFAPQGIAADENYVLVANTAFHYVESQMVYGQGFITVIDRRTRAIRATIKTTQLNPQRIAIQGQVAYVVNGGSTTLDSKTGLATVTSAGGLDILDLSGELPVQMSGNIPLGRNATDPRIGGYGSIALSDDGKYAFLGSGTRGDVFKIDLEQRRVTRGPDNPIELFPTPVGENGLTSIRRWKKGLAILDYNRDQICFSEDLAGDLTQRVCSTVGLNKELLEGPIDLAIEDGQHAYVLMTIANSVYKLRLDLGGNLETNTTLATTGLASNSLLLDGPYAYVLNSVDNNLQRIALAGGQSDMPFAVFPVKSNPFDMVITDETEGRVAWVTLFEANQVMLVNLANGAIIASLGQEQGAVDGGGTPEVPDAGVRCDGMPDVVGIHNVVQANYGAGAGYGQSALPGGIQGGPGAGPAPSLLSLGVQGELIVDFGDYEIIDGPGPDFIVFENPFLLGLPYRSFAEPALVGVSSSGTAPGDFVDFPCDLAQTQSDPEQGQWAYPGCAGVRPVLADAKRNCISPTDPAQSGGDPFDLSEISVARARYLRLKDSGLAAMGQDSKGFDLDAVVLLNFQKR
jgi:hypothetical protein